MSHSHLHTAWPTQLEWYAHNYSINLVQIIFKCIQLNPDTAPGFVQSNFKVGHPAVLIINNYANNDRHS